MRSWLPPESVAQTALTVDFDSPGAVILATTAAIAVLSAVVVGRRLPSRAGAVAAVCVTVLVTLFGLLAFEAHRAGRGTTLDHSVLGWALGHRRWWLTRVAIEITGLGSPAAITALTTIAAVVSWRTRSARTAVLLAATVVAAAIINTVIKHAVGAQRPPLADRAALLVHQTDPSFPSGHVVATLALVGIAAVNIGRGQSPHRQLLLATAATGVTAAMAESGLYLGVQWLTDVVGGALLAGSVVLISLALSAPRHCLQPRRGGPMMDSPHPCLENEKPMRQQRGPYDRHRRPL